MKNVLHGYSLAQSLPMEGPNYSYAVLLTCKEDYLPEESVLVETYRWVVDNLPNSGYEDLIRKIESELSSVEQDDELRIVWVNPVRVECSVESFKLRRVA